MEIMDIIKESFIFPSKDLAKLAVYIVLSLVTVFLGVIGGVLFFVGIMSEVLFTFIGFIILIAAFIVGFIVMGYQITIIKSGIDGDESAPQFIWKENLITGIKYLIVNIVYFIIPAIVVLIVGWATNLYGLSAAIFMKMWNASVNAPANATVVASNIIPQSALVSLGTAMIITGVVAAVLFIIFAFIHTMGESRLANTDDLGVALNIPEAIKDIGRIGWGKVIAVVILICLISFVINGIINGLNSFVNGISIVSIVVTPYLVFFAARATGLLYSDIA